MVGPEAEDVWAVGDGGQRSARGPARHLAERDPPAALHHRGRVDGRVGEGARGGEIARLPVDVAGGSELGDPPLVHRGGVASEQERLGGLGGGVHHGALAAREQPRELVAQLLAQLVVEVGERLVEEDEVRLLHQGAGQRGALLLAAGQLGRLAVEERREPEQLGDPAHPRLHLGGGQPRHPQRGGDVLRHREVLVVDELLVDHGHAPAPHRHAGDVASPPPTSPEVGRRSPAMRRMRVVFPARVGPSRMLKPDGASSRCVRWMCVSAPTRSSTSFRARLMRETRSLRWGSGLASSPDLS